MLLSSYMGTREPSEYPFFICLYNHSLYGTFICCRIDYCNSLFSGLPETRLSSVTAVTVGTVGYELGSQARCSVPTLHPHFCLYMSDVLHWLASRIQYKALLLVARTQQVYTCSSKILLWRNLQTSVCYLFPSSPVRGSA